MIISYLISNHTTFSTYYKLCFVYAVPRYNLFLKAPYFMVHMCNRFIFSRKNPKVKKNLKTHSCNYNILTSRSLSLNRTHFKVWFTFSYVSFVNIQLIKVNIWKISTFFPWDFQTGDVLPRTLTVPNTNRNMAKYSFDTTAQNYSQILILWVPIILYSLFCLHKYLNSLFFWSIFH